MLYCVLTESPEALNMINEGHIKSVISLLEKVGRDPKVSLSHCGARGDALILYEWINIMLSLTFC